MTSVIHVAILGSPVIEIGVSVKRDDEEIDFHQFLVNYYTTFPESLHESLPVTDPIGTYEVHGIPEENIFMFGQPCHVVSEMMNNLLSNYPTSMIITNDGRTFNRLGLNRMADYVGRPSIPPWSRVERYNQRRCSMHTSTYYENLQHPPLCALAEARRLSNHKKKTGRQA